MHYSGSTAGLSLAALTLAAWAAPAAASETIIYSYDAKGRLTKVERTGTVNNGVTTVYNHDKADNRTNVTVTGSANTGTASAASGGGELLLISEETAQPTDGSSEPAQTAPADASVQPPA